VQTTDLRILKEGTAYQSDVGMTGALDSVIGMKRDAIIRKFITGVNQRFEVCKKNMIMDLSIIDIDTRTGNAVYVEPLRIYEDTYEEQLRF
jgi:hypothetical protein